MQLILHFLMFGKNILFLHASHAERSLQAAGRVEVMLLNLREQGLGNTGHLLFIKRELDTGSK